MIRRFLCWLGWHQDITIRASWIDAEGNHRVKTTGYCVHCGDRNIL